MNYKNLLFNFYYFLVNFLSVLKIHEYTIIILYFNIVSIDTAALLIDLFIMGAGMVGLSPFACEAL